MTILRIAVDDEQVGALKTLLETVPFVRDVQEEAGQKSSDSLSSLNQLKAIIESAKGKNLFSEIEDPVEWQRQLRREWDRDF